MTAIMRGATLPVSLWANQAGRKADIAAGEGWLIGFAWLDHDAPFSDYRGFDRTITLLEGTGFALELPAGRTLTVREHNKPTAFDGAGPMACRLLGGPCRVLNVITAWPGYAHTVQILSGTALPTIAPGPLVFAVILRGRVGDAGLLDTLHLTEPMTEAGDAVLAVIRIEQEPAP